MLETYQSGPMKIFCDNTGAIALAKESRFHKRTKHIKSVGGNDTYGITGIPSTVDGRGVVRRARLGASTQIVYPGSGREDA